MKHDKNCYGCQVELDERRRESAKKHERTQFGTCAENLWEDCSCGTKGCPILIIKELHEENPNLKDENEKQWLAIQDVLFLQSDDVRQAKWKAQDFSDGAKSALDLVFQTIEQRLEE